MYIKLFHLYRLLGQLLPIYPVYLLMFQQKGLSITEVSGLLIIWSLPGLLLEVPSSILADCWNRKYLMVAGRVLKGLCFVVWSQSYGFSGFAAGFLLWGTGGALCSGTEEAWLYDALKVHGRENEFDRIWGRSAYYCQLTVGIISVAGSIIATFNMQLTLWLSVASIVLSTIAALFMPEYNFHAKTGSEAGFGGYFKTLRDGVSFCFSHSFVSILVGYNVTVLITAGILDEYDQLIVRSMGVPLALVGLWGFFCYGMEALGGRLAWRIRLLLNRFGINSPISIQFTLGVNAGLLLAFTAGFPVLPMLLLYVFYYFLMSSGKVLFTEALQSEIRHQGRATVQSLAAFLEAPSAIVIYALFGAAGGSGKLQGAMLAVVLWILGFCILYQVLYKLRRRVTADERQ